MSHNKDLDIVKTLDSHYGILKPKKYNDQSYLLTNVNISCENKGYGRDQ